MSYGTSSPGPPWGPPGPAGPPGPPGPPRTPASRGTSGSPAQGRGTPPWLPLGGGLAVAAVVAGVVFALRATGATHPPAAGRSSRPATGVTTLPTLAQPTASASGAPTGGGQPATQTCPSSPAPGPRHTLSFPGQIGGYKLVLKPKPDKALPFYHGNLCSAPDRRASYSNSADDFFDVYAGYHGKVFTNYQAFWQAFNGGSKVTMFPAGKLGGQVGCIELPSSGSICTWFDNDTFGEVVGNDPEPHTAAKLNAFRAAIEHGG